MAYLSAIIPASGQYFGYAPSFVNRAVVIPLTVTGNDLIQFDDNVSTAVPLYSGVVFEYNSPTTFLNFAIQGTSGDSFLIWFDKTSVGSGPKYVTTSGQSTNSNISGQSKTLDQIEDLYSGSFVFFSPAVNISTANSYVALQLTVAPNDAVQINSFTLLCEAQVNNVASNYYAGSSYLLPTEAEWHSLALGFVAIPAQDSFEFRAGEWFADCINGNTSAAFNQVYAGLPSSHFLCNVQTWQGKIYIANTTQSNQVFYFGIQHSGNAGEVNASNYYILSMNYQGLSSPNSSIMGISNAGNGGSGGGGGSRHNVF